MEKETVQATQGTERVIPAAIGTCPHCGISGFASVQSLSKHAGRCARQTHSNPNPSERSSAIRPTEPGKPAAPAVMEIGCPSCGSRITSDGKTLVKKSPALTKLERSEGELSNAEAEAEKLQGENKSLKEQLEATMKTPEQRLAERREALEKEHAELSEQIEKLGAEPEQTVRRFHVLTPSEEEKVNLLAKECERLKQQLQELEAKDGEKKTETEEPEESGRGRRRFVFHAA